MVANESLGTAPRLPTKLIHLMLMCASFALLSACGEAREQHNSSVAIENVSSLPDNIDIESPFLQVVSVVTPDATVPPEPSTQAALPEQSVVIEPLTQTVIPEQTASAESQTNIAVNELGSVSKDSLPVQLVPVEEVVGPSPNMGAVSESTVDIAQPIQLNVDAATSLFVDSSGGSDTGNGRVDQPLLTLRFALSKLAPGMTLYLRGGVYNDAQIPVHVSGTETARISIRNYPGERPIIDASIPEFRVAGSGNWLQVDEAIGLYRSERTDFTSDIYTGKARVGIGRQVTLVPYYDDAGSGARGLDDLRSTTHHVSAAARYVGPGIYNDSGRLYVRLQPPTAEAMHGRSSNDVGSTVAEAVSFEISDADTVLEVEGSFVDISGLRLQGARAGVEIKSGARSLSISDMTFAVAGNAILIRAGTLDVDVTRCRFEGNFPDHIAWTDMKGGDGQSMPASHWTMKSSGINASSITGLRVTESVFDDVFDGLVINDSHSVEVRGNAGFFVDDMIQIGSNSSYVHVLDNVVEGAGPSHYGKGDSPEPGTIYIGGNIIDSRTEILWGKYDPSSILRTSYSGWAPQRPFPTHSASALVSGDPWKIYNNTVLFDSRADGAGAGFTLWDQLNNTGAAHEVLNNIFINYGDGPFARQSVTTEWDQIYDGNLYWRVGGAAAVPFEKVVASSGSFSFDSLDAFLASPAFAESILVYPPGWEASGSDADPRLDTDLRPAADGPAASGSVAASVQLPGGPRTYRGAVAP